MGERKVLNKYIPADFDPKLVPRGKKPKDDLVPVRMMLPFSIQCSTCSSFLYRGRKFNSKKEPVRGIDGKYLGIQRFRFYIKCSDCSRPITFLTDPKNADYEMESGGTRNYEVWHDENKTNADFEKQNEEDEKLDSMKALENRVAESQREMAELDALEEIRAMNARHVGLMKGGGKRLDAAGAVLKAREEAMGKKGEEVDLNENGLTVEEEDLVKSIKFGAAAAVPANNDFGDGGDNGDGNGSISIRRLDEEDELLAEKLRMEAAEASIRNKQSAGNGDTKKKSNVPVFKVKAKRKKKKVVAAATVPEPKRAKINSVNKSAKKLQKDGDSDSGSNGGGALSGLLGYGTDSS